MEATKAGVLLTSSSISVVTRLVAPDSNAPQTVVIEAALV
jgi:hypothetical protein